MRNLLLDGLVALNRPEQFLLLENAIDVFTASPSVTQLLVRGSLATGTADRLSNVDFVVGVADDDYIDFVSVLDALMMAELHAIMPGWRDTGAGDMGGLGYVYLVACQERLRQLDIYVVPESALDHNVISALPVFTRADTDVSLPSHDAMAFIARTIAEPRTCGELLIEFMVRGFLIGKRVMRRQRFAAYRETHMFNAAVKNLIKVALAPDSRDYGWDNLHTDIGATPIGKRCLADLDALLSGPAVPTIESLDQNIARALALAERAAPEAVEALRKPIDAYLEYLELLRPL
ncbi:hypothetical protein GFY24_34385 [Nocardia sp. SYP-A9097]|uniref:hypothetical protein n=1 Tax=Nocardia sp. SYP-A9097 TaxID=2663237 RepID=UPI00129BA102|nr:hypothetical protein [Nocardia sp. SYP-A9097]MRH92453.1 hypothetical protein [Nocardia sp. SYP-A9097]